MILMKYNTMVFVYGDKEKQLAEDMAGRPSVSWEEP